MAKLVTHLERVRLGESGRPGAARERLVSPHCRVPPRVNSSLFVFVFSQAVSHPPAGAYRSRDDDSVRPAPDALRSDDRSGDPVGQFFIR